MSLLLVLLVQPPGSDIDITGKSKTEHYYEQNCQIHRCALLRRIYNLFGHGPKDRDNLQYSRPKNDNKQGREEQEHEREDKFDGSLRRGLLSLLPTPQPQGI